MSKQTNTLYWRRDNPEKNPEKNPENHQNIPLACETILPLPLENPRVRPVGYGKDDVDWGRIYHFFDPTTPSTYVTSYDSVWFLDDQGALYLEGLRGSAMLRPTEQDGVYTCEPLLATHIEKLHISIRLQISPDEFAGILDIHPELLDAQQQLALKKEYQHSIPTINTPLPMPSRLAGYEILPPNALPQTARHSFSLDLHIRHGRVIAGRIHPVFAWPQSDFEAYTHPHKHMLKNAHKNAQKNTPKNTNKTPHPFPYVCPWPVVTTILERCTRHSPPLTPVVDLADVCEPIMQRLHTLDLPVQEIHQALAAILKIWWHPQRLYWMIALLKHPQLSPEDAAQWFAMMPKAILENPSFPLWILENPAFLQEILHPQRLRHWRSIQKKMLRHLATDIDNPIHVAIIQHLAQDTDPHERELTRWHPLYVREP